MPHGKQSAKRVKARRRAEAKQYVIDAKQSPCMDCGGSYPHYVMDFDHRPGVDKRFEMSQSKDFSKDTIQKEIDKCDLVCSNCHRIRTYERLDIPDNPLAPA